MSATRARMDCGVSQFPGSVDADPWGVCPRRRPTESGTAYVVPGYPIARPAKHVPETTKPGSEGGVALPGSA